MKIYINNFVYKTIKFSILLSIYKNEKNDYLNKSLYSIFVKQSIVPDEVILVKDGLLTESLEHDLHIWKINFHAF